jgi:FAD dependent oxidoreductase TIGR03364
VKRAVVAGGGILGTWHALELCRAGYAVQHLEADAVPQGASVRNFGLIWVSGRRSGVELDAALRSRRRWEEVGEDIPGLGFRATGSLTVARTEGERKVMEEFAHHADAAERSTTYLSPDELVALNPAVQGDVAGGLHCAHDAVVEPRLALSAMRSYLLARGSYAYHPGRRVVGMEAQAVVDATGQRWEADLVIVASGAAFDHLPGSERIAARLRRVRLQMMETAPLAATLTTSLADADTLRYYPAYDVVPLDTLGSQNAVAAAHHLQLLMVQRLDGGLTIGDTHAYDEPFDFALAEEPSTELLHRAEELLGAPLPAVTRRWEGVYAQCTDGDVCAREEVQPGVWMVTGPGGRGMTCSPAIAADTLTLTGVTGVTGVTGGGGVTGAGGGGGGQLT